MKCTKDMFVSFAMIASLKPKVRAAARLLIYALLSVSAISGNQAFGAMHSFDADKGVLSVDYASYLSKHDVVFTTTADSPQDGTPFGNGRIGGMIANTYDVSMEITAVDAVQQTCLSLAMAKLITEPGLGSDNPDYRQRLKLWDGTVVKNLGTNRTITFFGDPNAEILGIHVKDTRSNVTSAVFELSIWDVSSLNNEDLMIDLPNIAAWQQAAVSATATSISLSRGQTDADNFGYTVAATVEGTAFTTQKVDNHTVRLNITPATDYTIWIACGNRKFSPAGNSADRAEDLLTQAKNAGFAPVYAASLDYWHSFWPQSFVQYSSTDGRADYAENFYYVSEYLIAGAARANYPAHWKAGVYRFMQDFTYWQAGYWWIDTRPLYTWMFAANHTDLFASLQNLFVWNLPRLKSDTQSEYGFDGAKIPETIMWDGSNKWNEGDFVRNILSTSLEVAEHLWWKFKFSNDTTFLRDTAYAVMKETVTFHKNCLSFDAAAKKYYISSANSRENYWNVKNPLPDLAGIRATYPMFIEASRILNTDNALRTELQNILDSLVDYPTANASDGGKKYLPCSPPVPGQNNTENPECEIIYPHGQRGLGSIDYQTAVNTYRERKNAHVGGYNTDNVLAARLGLADSAYSAILKKIEINQLVPGGLCTCEGDYCSGTPNMENNGHVLSAINESMLHSHSDTIRVFPAIPAALTGKFTLLAQEGFLVSSEFESGEIKYVGIKSLHGKNAVMFNPWGTEELRVRRISDNELVLTTTSVSFGFATDKNNSYVVERTAKPLSSYTFTQLSGTPNEGAKTLGSSQLGKGPQVPTITALTAKTLCADPVIRISRGAAGMTFLRISGLPSGENRIVIFSLDGRCVTQKRFRGAESVLQAGRDFRSAAYIVRIESGDAVRIVRLTAW